MNILTDLLYVSHIFNEHLAFSILIRIVKLLYSEMLKLLVELEVDLHNYFLLRTIEDDFLMIVVGYLAIRNGQFALKRLGVLIRLSSSDSSEDGWPRVNDEVTADDICLRGNDDCQKDKEELAESGFFKHSF